MRDKKISVFAVFQFSFAAFIVTGAFFELYCQIESTRLAPDVLLMIQWLHRSLVVKNWVLISNAITFLTGIIMMFASFGLFRLQMRSKKLSLKCFYILIILSALSTVICSIFLFPQLQEGLSSNNENIKNACLAAYIGLIASFITVPMFPIIGIVILKRPLVNSKFIG